MSTIVSLKQFDVAQLVPRTFKRASKSLQEDFAFS